MSQETPLSQPIQIGHAGAPRSGGCGCGGHDDQTPVLDVRTIPHAVRHGAVFGAFDAVPAGASLIIVAPHAPTPLLAQLAQRAPIEAEYVVEGPDEWHVRITRLED